MRKNDFEFKYIGNCPVCSSQFEPGKASIIEKKDHMSHVYAECSKCTSSVSCFVLENKMGTVTTIGMLTDMTKEDIMRFKMREPITANEVKKIHQIIEQV